MLTQIYNRDVLQYKLPYEITIECGDCHEIAKYAIIELTKNKRNSVYHKAWFWCGKCDIG